MGITFIPIDDVGAKLNNLPEGLQIKSVEEGMDIATKDVRTDDIITHMDGVPVSSGIHVAEILKTKKPGDEIKLSVCRVSATGGMTEFEVSVVLVEDKGILF